MSVRIALGLAAVVLTAAAGQPPAPPTDWAPTLSAFARRAPLSAGGARRIEAAAWWGGAYTTTTGEQVTVFVSESYAHDRALGQRWADFFAGLLHRTELGTMRAYVAPVHEVRAICGSHAIGCYGGGRLVTIGEPAEGVAPEAVAAHEYGHHVASTRRNPPWRAGAWGPKRWASQANVCARAATGSAFPGDQDANYTLNPGEAFAEVYRVLNETRSGAPSFAWDLIDPSFAPDAAALRAAEADVVDPWTAPATRTIRAGFAGDRRTLSFRVATPLDGEVGVSLRLGAGAGHELALLGPDGRRVLASGLWSGSGEKSVAHTVCGERSVIVRVTRRAGAPRFVVRVAAP